MVFTQQNGAGDNHDDTNSDADPSTGLTSVITLSAGEVDLTIDAGVRVIIPASVGDYAWLDSNSDGIQDSGEPGVGGIIATLYDASNNPVGSAITDGKGYYQITNIAAGSGYYIIFSNLPVTGVYTLQTSNVTPSDATLGSDPNVATGQTASFGLTAGEYLPTVDAGILWPTTHVLPVGLLSFTADKENSISLLHWSTSQEVNSSYIVIEHSLDGINFTDLGRVPAAGNSVLITNYSYRDVHPNGGRNYYRLRIVSEDGHVQYSVIRLVRFDKPGSIVVYPNPVGSQLSILLPDDWTNRPVSLTLYNGLGQEVLNKQVGNAQQTELLNVTRMPNGVYTLKLKQSDNTTEYIKIQVTK
jgi:hypothetical protein